MLIRLFGSLFQKSPTYVGMDERRRIIELVIMEDEMTVRQGRRWHVGIDGVVKKTLEILDEKYPDGYYVRAPKDTREVITCVVNEEVLDYEMIVTQDLVVEASRELSIRDTDLKTSLIRHITLNKALIDGRIVDLNELEEEVEIFLKKNRDKATAGRLMDSKHGVDTSIINPVHANYYGCFQPFTHDTEDSFSGKQSHSNSGFSGNQISVATAGISSTLGSSSCSGSGDSSSSDS